jgi:hypothetical protein
VRFHQLTLSTRLMRVGEKRASHFSSTGKAARLRRPTYCTPAWLRIQLGT